MTQDPEEGEDLIRLLPRPPGRSKEITGKTLDSNGREMMIH